MKKRVRLSSAFYRQDTEVVAKKLLGQRLVHVHRGKRVSGIITETEAYLGCIDKACHTFGGRRTPRVKSMYLEGGHAYIYLIYGMYFCFNVVTRTETEPEAVLIRALEPVEGIEQMVRWRNLGKGVSQPHKLTTGPGKLCKALNITRELDGENLGGETLFIEKEKNIPADQIVARPRVGIDYAQEAKHWPLRFYIKDNTYISKK